MPSDALIYMWELIESMLIVVTILCSFWNTKNVLEVTKEAHANLVSVPFHCSTLGL